VWEALEHGSVASRIEQQVLRVINDEDLRPGDRLPSERQLAQLLGVSRPTLREAIGSLRAQGRVAVRHGQGVFVTEARTSRDLRSALATQKMTLSELFAMREVLEVPAAGWAAKSDDSARITGISAAYEATVRAMQGELDWHELQTADAQFHMAIVKAADNRFLGQTLGILQTMLAAGMDTTLTVPGRLERSRRDHRRILTALQAGDSVAARRAVRLHIRGAAAAAQRRLEDEL